MPKSSERSGSDHVCESGDGKGRSVEFPVNHTRVHGGNICVSVIVFNGSVLEIMLCWEIVL